MSNERLWKYTQLRLWNFMFQVIAAYLSGDMAKTTETLDKACDFMGDAKQYLDEGIM